MRTTSKEMIAKINEKLARYDQLIRIEEWSGKHIKLSSGKVLVDADRRKFIVRLLSKKNEEWIKNIDALLAGTKHENDIKSNAASLGGKSVQRLYGESIRLNLNTGVPWNKNMRGLYHHRVKPNAKTIEKQRQSKLGDKNPMFGRKHTDEYKKAMSVATKQRILDGKFTPNSNNKNTHWDSILDGRKYRSSWEALYHYLNPLAEFETLRLPYVYNDNTLIYIVDFVDYASKIVTEVKPNSMLADGKTAAKISALQYWAIGNGFEMLIADESYFASNRVTLDYARFDEKTAIKIRSFYETC